MTLTREIWEQPTKLIDWIDEPNPKTGVFFENGLDWEYCAYDSLAASVRRLSGVLSSIEPDGVGRVGVVASDLKQFVVGFYGALYSGGTPVPIAPPSLISDDYRAYVSAIADSSDMTTCIVSDAERAVLADGRWASAPTLISSFDEGVELSSRRPANDLALVQFSSGSTGQPRGVMVPTERLEFQMEMITRWLHWMPHDGTASWLPAYHDLGLIGCLITPVCTQTNLWLMTPERFVLRPKLWLECLAGQGATLAAAPTFAFSYVARRLKPSSLDGMDFSDWRVAICAAERLEGAAFKAFFDLVSPFGFKAETWRPAYGMAEATLGISGNPVSETAPMLAFDHSTQFFGEKVSIDERAKLGETESAPTGRYLVSSGRPMYKVELDIIDEEGECLPEGHLGEIVVRSQSLSSGYLTSEESGTSSLADDRLLTGDAGFLDNGHLYILGRIVDSINVRGRLVYVEPIEARLATVANIPARRCVIVPAQGTSAEDVVAIVEKKRGEWLDDAAKLLRSEFGGQFGIRIVSVKNGEIPRTTSGKPKRRLLWRGLLSGEFEAMTVYEEAPHL